MHVLFSETEKGYKQMLLKGARKMDDFEEDKNFDSKGKIYKKQKTNIFVPPPETTNPLSSQRLLKLQKSP